MKVLLDAGALIAIERDDRRLVALIKLARRNGAVLMSTTGVVAQVWRGGSRQALLARAIPTIEIRPFLLDDAKRAGELLGAADTSDVIDAALILLATPGDQIVTSDLDDMVHLGSVRSVAVTITHV